MNTQITEDYCDFETAKLLKEKGFDIPCDNYYDSSGKTLNESVYGGANIETLDYNADPFVKSGFHKFKTFSAPTQSMAMKWLRKIYSLEIYPYHDFPKVGDKWWFEIIKYPNTVSEYESETAYNSYEEACEAALKYCLTDLI